MSPRRVLHVLDTAHPGGAAICGMVTQLAAGLNPARYQIHACFLEPGALLEHFRRAGIPATCVQWSGSAAHLAGAARYARLLRAGGFSIVHQHTGGRFLTGLGRWLTGARRVRTLHFRAVESTGVVPAHFQLPPCDALIAVSRAVAEFSGDPRAVVVHPGVDAARFLWPRPSHTGLVIGTACRLEPIKGLHTLLQAFAALAPQFPQARLQIAGDGSLRAALEEQCLQLGIAGQVDFLGWRDDMPQLLAGWDIFALPSLDEAFPIAALEAMAAGLPVVASAAGGLRELVQEGATGWLVPAGDSLPLSQRLGQLLGDEQTRQAMGAAGRERALRDFSLPRMVEQTTAVYDRLLAAP